MGDIRALRVDSDFPLARCDHEVHILHWYRAEQHLIPEDQCPDVVETFSG